MRMNPGGGLGMGGKLFFINFIELLIKNFRKKTLRH